MGCFFAFFYVSDGSLLLPSFSGISNDRCYFRFDVRLLRCARNDSRRGTPTPKGGVKAMKALDGELVCFVPRNDRAFLWVDGRFPNNNRDNIGGRKVGVLLNNYFLAFNRSLYISSTSSILA